MALTDIPKYYLVAHEALPAVLVGVIRAKELLDSGEAATIAKATRLAGISRSAFYKYRYSVSPFFDTGSSRIITFHILLRNTPGLLSAVLLIFANCGANILTINQSIPVSGRAVVTISAETNGVTSGVEDILGKVGAKSGVISIEAISG